VLLRKGGRDAGEEPSRNIDGNKDAMRCSLRISVTTGLGRRHYMQLPEEHGPLMMGARGGAASGAGIRFGKTVTGGVPAPEKTVGLWKTPRPKPCAPAPRAKPGVDTVMQATATMAAANTRFMLSLLLVRALVAARHVVIEQVGYM
jgi:hypothetical protein